MGCLAKAYLVQNIFFLLIIFLFPAQEAGGSERRLEPVERRILAEIKSYNDARKFPDKRCHFTDRYKIYLIDNFEQNVPLIPEIRTSHGELLRRIIVSGRDDIDLEIIDTGLTKGLALVLAYLENGECADAVVSSIPGSNYSYGQLNTFIETPEPIASRNILRFRKSLLERVKGLALNGYPSVDWLDNLKANPSKLMNDSIKLNFIEALQRYSVPVLLPYGNVDTPYDGESRNVNLLSLSLGAKVFSGADGNEKPLTDYPDSILSSGRSKAVFTLRECPHPTDVFYALLDVNEDGVFDYTFKRDNFIAFQRDGELLYAPPVMEKYEFEKLKEILGSSADCSVADKKVFAADQYKQLCALCRTLPIPEQETSYYWLNSSSNPWVTAFNASCRNRGQLYGTSFIPPNLVKELLPRSH